MNTFARLNRVWMAAVVAIALTISFSSHLFADSMTHGSGTFTGMNNHVTTGSVEIIKTDEGYAVKLGADFSFDGAPDPKVELGKDGVFDPATMAENLRSNTGEQTYVLPASLNIADYNEVYIWCEKFSVGLGIAPIN